MTKIILVTGASSGIGKNSAKDLIQAGHKVYCVARSVDKMADLANLGGHVMKMDVTKEEEMDTVVSTIIAKEGKIDVLWNNAGYGLFGPVEEVSMEEAKMQFEVNVFGLARMTQKVLPYMRKQEKGLIINTSSIGGKIYTPLGAWYHASKHAIEGFSDCLRIEVKEFGIDVVVLEPGIIKTKFYQDACENFSLASQTGAYKGIVNSCIKLLNNLSAMCSKPQVISNAVLRIINSPKPKTRYVVGRGAKLLVAMRKILSDKIYDTLLQWQLK